jgi:hypothetical protein
MNALRHLLMEMAASCIVVIPDGGLHLGHSAVIMPGNGQLLRASGFSAPHIHKSVISGSPSALLQLTETECCGLPSGRTADDKWSGQQLFLFALLVFIVTRVM